MAGCRRFALAGFYRAFDKLMSRLRIGKGQYFVLTLVLSGHDGLGFFIGLAWRCDITI